MPAGSANAERAEQVVRRLEHVAREVWTFLRFLLFGLYLMVAAFAFWLWVVLAIIGLIRLVLKAVMLILLWLSGGVAPPEGPRPANWHERVQHTRARLRHLRVVAYEDFVWPLGKHLQRFGDAVRQFWHWSLFRKAAALASVGGLVIIPGLYVIPRPHEVRITDDNAVVYDQAANRTSYLVHAVDLHASNKTREYINEDAWYLGKINAQGLKSRLQQGRTYRLWVVGIRWYYLPRLYPNIISATEIDAGGKEVEPAAAPAAPAPVSR